MLAASCTTGNVNKPRVRQKNACMIVNSFNLFGFSDIFMGKCSINHRMTASDQHLCVCFKSISCVN